MGNRRKSHDERRRAAEAKHGLPDRRTLIKESALNKVQVPKAEKAVAKQVPATIKWADVGNIDRDAVEVVGTCLIYEDGTQDVIIFDEISQDAKDIIYSFQSGTLKAEEVEQDE